MVDFDKIKQLREEIEKLLEERPEYRDFQEKIDIALKKAGDPAMCRTKEERGRVLHNRQAILQDMMLTTWRSILPHLEELKECVEGIRETAEGGLK